MAYKIKDEEELLSLCMESLRILNNLRYTTKDWEEKYGAQTKTRKKHWEKKADELLDKLDLLPCERQKEIDIKIEITTKG